MARVQIGFGNSLLIYKMRSFFVLLCLILLHSTSSVVILQSNLATTIVSPAGASTIYSVYYNSNFGGIAGAGVEWIASSKASAQTHYQSLFYANCIGSAKLTITAATSFNAYLDGVFIGTGSNHSTVFKFPLKLSCGNHNLTIVVYSAVNANQALIFALDQDQSGCFKCQATGFWNQNTCSCTCINNQYGCQCKSPKIWRNYPICGCGCPSIIFRPPILKATKQIVVNETEAVPEESKTPAAADDASSKTSDVASPDSAVSKSLIFYCLYPRYYSQETCSCVCHYQYCPPKYYFDDQTCSCFAILT